MIETHIPVEHLNAELRKLGRGMDNATIVSHGWQGDQYGLQMVWADGYSTFVGLGSLATAVLESAGTTKH